jgi:protein gp37
MYRESMNGTRYEPKNVTRTKTVFNLPLKLSTPSKIFASSLTDFFHEECDAFRHEAWAIIKKCPQHTFQILTKRIDRARNHLPALWQDGWKNVWMGTSIGSQASTHRMVDLVVGITAKIKFLSLEPLRGPIDLNAVTWQAPSMPNVDFQVLGGIHWVIVGGESGNNIGQYRYRECKIEWIEMIIDQCQRAGIPVFVKQLGTHLAKQLKLSDRHGGNIDEWPQHLQIREFPRV